MRVIRVALLFGMLATPATEALAGWLYRDSVDVMTDAASARAFVQGEGGSFGLKCDEPGRNKLYLQFISEDFLGGNGVQYAVRQIMLRIDQDGPEEMYWRYSDRSAALVHTKDVWRIAARLRTSSRLAVRAWDYQGRQHDAVFETNGADEAFDRVIATCRAAAQESRS